MSWTQHDSEWRCPLGVEESAFLAIAASGMSPNKENLFVMAAVRIKVSSPSNDVHLEQRLRSIWANLRLCHPGIATALRDGEKCYQPTTTGDGLKAWVASSFYVETVAASVDDLFSQHLKFPHLKNSASCHWLPASSELAIGTSHWRCDGRGLFMLLHEFLTLLARPHIGATIRDLGSETANLVPSFDAIMRVPHSVLPENSRRADAILSDCMKGGSSIGLPVASGKVPGNTVRLETSIPNIASTLRAACRARGIRLSAALHASIIATTARYCQADAADEPKYRSIAVFDLRKHCPKPFDGPLHAAALRATALPIAVDATDNWNYLAKHLHSVYRETFEPGKKDMMFVRIPLIERMASLLATPTTEPWLSNLGVLDDYVSMKYGDVNVENVWLGVQAVTPQLVVHTWSWNGRLHISACYNESFYEAAFVKQWLEEVKTNLLKNLGV
ncbi:hypothetical protein F5B22DRAFT_34054 [Xylaria bambusicola]|uniref:uncharacterized protein n=1 Tax=Xylaria bambusicola TaxID=326684 RepID=UPI0020084ABC|nr:uncharacterized protein F5B22DRAFT_34054 [Xylaria bambusicola]KAI0521013.1 hypothetical protein F5B22DRAFT_34054 [Xylaria bambusicola]